MTELMTEDNREQWERWWSEHNAMLHELGKHVYKVESFCPRCPTPRPSSRH